MGTSSRFDQIMSAVTFAEAGEFQTARAMMPAQRPAATLSWFERIFAAVALAEGGLHEDAKRISRLEPINTDFLSNVGLKGVRVHYAIMAS